MLLQRQLQATAAVTTEARLDAFGVRASCGGMLRLGGDGKIVNMRSADGARSAATSGPAVLLLRSRARPDIGFLVAASADPVPLRFEHEALGSVVRAVRICRWGGSETVAIRHPFIEWFACSQPCADESEATGAVMLDRSLVGGWEVHALVPAEPFPELDESLALSLDAAASLSEGSLGGDAIAAWLATASSRTLSLVGEAVLSLASDEAIDRLATLVLERAELGGRLASVWPDNPWMGSVLPDLLDWSATRRSRDVVPVMQDWDVLAGTFGPGRTHADLPRRLIAAIRGRVAPRRRLAIVATARNEGAYFLDWIAHHRAIGVEHFFIYSNDNDDGSDVLLTCLARAGVITFLPNTVATGINAQMKSYQHALAVLPETLEYRWTAFIDVDEFLVVDPARFGSFASFLDLQEQRHADAVALNWRMYTAGGQSAFVDEPVPDRMRMREPAVNPHVKSVVRTAFAWGSTCHAPIWPDGAKRIALDALGQLHSAPGGSLWDSQFRHKADAGPAWINHYHLRSLPEYVVKASRNRGTQLVRALRFRTDNDFIAGFVHWFDNADAVEDLTIASFADAAAAELRSLAALDGVADAHRAAVDAFARMAKFLVEDLAARLGEVAEPCREPLSARVRESLSLGVVIGAARGTEPSATAPADGRVRIELRPCADLGERMVQYMAALAVQSRLDRPSVISNVRLPEWGIVADPIGAGGEDIVLDRSRWRVGDLLPAPAYQAAFGSRPQPATAFGEDVLLISLRGGADPLASLPPVGFYAELVARHGLCPVFLGRPAPGPYAQALREAFPTAEFIDGLTPLQEFEALRGASNLCLSASLLAWAAAYLSAAGRIVYPMIGLLHPAATRCLGQDVDLLPCADERCEFWLFPVTYGAPDAGRGRSGRWRRVDASTWPGDEMMTCDVDQYLDLLDEQSYRAGLDRRTSAREHYRLHGFDENRAAFRLDPIHYARSYPYAAEAVGFGRYLDFHHFHVAVGRLLGYRPVPSS